MDGFQKLREIVAALRGPGGCPWDKEQTHVTLAPYAIEEAFELVEALERGNDDEELKSELGDVLFQVLLHSQIASETGRFDVEGVIEVLSEKMVRRHPHVFGATRVTGSAEVLTNWEKIKAREKESKGLNASKEYLETPKGLPALMEAEKIGARTRKVGFDWTEVSAVLSKVKEEIAELEEALALTPPTEKTKEALALEIGDSLFSLAQLARHLDIDAEQALRKTNQKFRRRFQHMLKACGQDLDGFAALSAPEKERLWESAKLSEKI